MKKFKEIGVNQQICKAIAELGFVNPTEAQKESIPFLLNNDSDLISLAQTGTERLLHLGYLLSNRLI